MKIVVSTHQGVLYNEDVNYVVVKNDDGEFAVMHNHVPIISVFPEGFLKLVQGDNSFYVAIINGIFEFKDNSANIIAQEAHIGESIEDAKAYIETIRKENVERNRQKNIDYTEQENELKRNIKASRAGNL